MTIRTPPKAAATTFMNGSLCEGSFTIFGKHGGARLASSRVTGEIIRPISRRTEEMKRMIVTVIGAAWMLSAAQTNPPAGPKTNPPATNTAAAPAAKPDHKKPHRKKAHKQTATKTNPTPTPPKK
ncbi:MAG: hypothetical protein HY235_10890 [Acidobacteria bacterium]|nr:hypothetical protein [Acidobacteriota bacterium]